MSLTIGSLFAGIGGMELGLERAGWKCRWQVEIDDYATRVLEKHWPHVERFRDVREVGRHNLTPVSLIAGGFPCQDISSAGAGAGLDGRRSRLWYEFARVVGELRPDYVLVENSPMLLARGIDRVLGQLATLGYDAEWDCIPASSIGAPHERDRIFIVAHSQEFGRGSGRTGELQPVRPLSQVADTEGARLALTTSGESRISGFAGPQRGCIYARRPAGTWPDEPAIRRMADGIPNRVDRLRGLGNAVVPQVAEHIGRMILEDAAACGLLSPDSSEAIVMTSTNDPARCRRTGALWPPEKKVMVRA